MGGRRQGEACRPAHWEHAVGGKVSLATVTVWIETIYCGGSSYGRKLMRGKEIQIFLQVSRRKQCWTHCDCGGESVRLPSPPLRHHLGRLRGTCWQWSRHPLARILWGTWEEHCKGAWAWELKPLNILLRAWRAGRSGWKYQIEHIWSLIFTRSGVLWSL